MVWLLFWWELMLIKVQWSGSTLLKAEEEVTVHDFAFMVSACHYTASASGCRTPSPGT